MIKVEELLNKFLVVSGYEKREDIKAIVLYGSRVRGTSNENSDLDIFMISSEKNNFKVGKVIDGVKIDCNIFSIFDLFDIAYEKKIKNSKFFESILKTGKVVLNKEGIIEEFTDYVFSLKNENYKKERLSNNFLGDLYDCYFNYRNSNADFWYFNLLEMIRMAYHYKNRYSQISMVKVYDTYNNKEKYEKDYLLKLPDDKFISIYLKALLEKDKHNRLDFISELLELSDIQLSNNIFNIHKDTFRFIQDNKIKEDLLILYNKLCKVIEYLKTDNPYKELTYNVLLKQIYDYYLVLNQMIDDDFNSLYSQALIERDVDKKIHVLKDLFCLLDKYYRFNYEDYILKLV